MTKKVFVSGCFDLLHSGHVAFFEEASKYGDLYVSIGSDRNVFMLKNRPTINSQAERLYMIKSLTYVKDVFVARGSGVLDFVSELKEIRPDYFIVNEDGHSPEKKDLCDGLGINYIVLKREPHQGLTARSTTALRDFSTIPFGLDLAGNLFDQPGISNLHPGSVLTVSIHPSPELGQEKSELSNTRACAQEIWGARLPFDRPEKLARMLFAYSNFPGQGYHSIASESIGIVYSGLVKADYARGFWPEKITSVQDDRILKFVEDVIHLAPLGSQQDDPRKLNDSLINIEALRELARAIEAGWQALFARDIEMFGSSLQRVARAQALTLNDGLDAAAREVLAQQPGKIHGWMPVSIGSNFYLALVAEMPIENTFRINVRRLND